MDEQGIFISPSSIITANFSMYEDPYNHHHFQKILIVTKELKNHFGGGVENKSYQLEYDLTNEGFQFKKEIENVKEHLLSAMKFPLTCGFLIKFYYNKEKGKLDVTFV